MRGWLRFSLWQMLAMTLVVALVLALVLNPILARRRVTRRIEQLGATISADLSVPASHLETIRYVIEQHCFGSQPAEIRTLDARGCAVTDNDLKWICRLEKLRELDLSFTGVTDTGISQLESLRELRLLSLNGTRVSARHIEMFEGMPMLRDVQMLGTQASASDGQRGNQRKRGLTVTCSQADLQASAQVIQTLFRNGVDLQYYHKLRDDSIAKPVLQALITGQTKDFSAVIPILKTLPVDIVGIVGHDFSDEEAQALGQLRVAALSMFSAGFRNYDWLREIQGLQKLYFYDLSNPNDFATVLHQIPDLRHMSAIPGDLTSRIEPPQGLLSLTVKDATDEHVIWITSLPNLRSLQLIRPAVSHDAYGRLADEIRLERLTLRDCSVTEQALNEIARMRSLHALRLEGGLTDAAGVTRLSQLQQLAKLRIFGASTDDVRLASQLAELALALPRCKIEADVPIASENR